VKFRKIKKSEVKTIAKILSECFMSYPLYDVIFKDSENRKKSLFYLLWLKVYIMQNYTYINSDCSAICIIKEPGDCDCHPFFLFLNPFFFIGYLLHVPKISRILDREYKQLTRNVLNKFYNPKSDGYIEFLGAEKENRGRDFFEGLSAFIQQFGINGWTYSDTHDARNIRLFTLIGAELLEKFEWHGLTEYFFRIRCKDMKHGKKN